MNVMQKSLRRFRTDGRRGIIFLLCLVVYLSISTEETAKAASSSIYFESSSQEVTVGDEITVTLCIDADVTLGDFEGYISYNSEVLEYQNNNGSITGGEGTLKVYDFGTSSKNTRKYLMNFKVIDIGKCEFHMSDSSIAYEFENGDAMSVSSTAYMIQAVSKKTASDNTNLATVNISPGSLTPGFESSVLTYNTIVDENTDKLIVSAIPEDMKSKVSIRGNDTLSEGNNDVIIQVTSESGKTKEYKITVFKEITENGDAKETEEDSDGDTQDSEGTEGSKEENVIDPEWRFEAVSKDGELFLTGKYYYTVVDSSEVVDIPIGYVQSSFILDGYTFTAYQEESNPGSDYLLLILKNEAGKVGLYRYDRIEKTIQRYPDEKIIIQSSTSKSDEMTELTGLVKNYEEKLSQLGLVIAFLCGTIGILIIVFIKYFLKTRGMQDDDLD